jgi:hypothetical protein
MLLASASAALGQSGIAFAPPQVIQLEAGFFPTAIVPRDVDGDGWLDLLVPGRGGEGSVLLLKGGPGGVLGPPMAIPTGVPADAIAVEDFDGDGQLDLAVPGRRLVGRGVLLRGLGGGAFAEAATFPLGREPRGAAAGDFDGDGGLDLAFANYGSSSVEGHRGDGLAFSAGPARVVGRETRGHGYPVEVRAADLDGDGRDEAILPAIGAGRLQIAGFGGEPLQAERLRSIAPFEVDGQRPALTSIATLDLEGDGDTDLLVPTVLIAPVQHLFLFRNDGGGDLTDRRSVPLAMLGYLWSAALADFDGDGRLDLATGSALPGVLSVWRNLAAAPGGIEVAQPATLFEEVFIRSVAVADLDADGRPDLIATAYDTHRLVVFLNRSGDGVAGGDGTTGRRAKRSANDATVRPTAATPRLLPRGDRNGDGRTDAIDLALELAAWGPESRPVAAEGRRR